MIYVIAYAHFDYECSEFYFNGFEKKEDAEKAIMKLLNGRTNMDGNRIYTKDNIHVLKGKEVAFIQKAKVIENVKIK